MGGFILFLYFSCIIISILVWVRICKTFQNIARDKGHDSIKYFLLPFFFGIIGFLIVAALPDRDNPQIASLKKEILSLKQEMEKLKPKKEEVFSPPKPVAVQTDSHESLSSGNTFDGDFWICGKCGKRNTMSNPECWNCENKR